jgi:hypothetical protein
MAKKTGEAAEAAKESAKAARDLAEMERQRMMTERRPELVAIFPGRRRSGSWEANIENKGPGAATKPRLFVRFMLPESNQDHEIALPQAIEPGRTEHKWLKVDPDTDRSYSIAIALCHYESAIPGQKAEAYHSVYVHHHPPKRGPMGFESWPTPGAHGYFPPERPIDQDLDHQQHLTICKVCNR